MRNDVCKLMVGKKKHKALYEWLINGIESGLYPYGSKLPSEMSLCNKFNISRQTVRNAMHELVLGEYISSHQGKGYFVTKNIIRCTDNTIGVFLNYADDYVFPEVLSGIVEVLQRNGYGIDLGMGYNKVSLERAFLKRMLANNAAGAIIRGTKSGLPSPNEDLYLELKAKNVPLVFVQNYYSSIPCHALVMDDRNLTYLLTKKLIDVGHRKIGGIFKFDDAEGHQRYLGYVQALMDSGIHLDEKNILWFESSQEARSAIERDRCYDRFASLVAKQCTAAVCFNDKTASSIIKRLLFIGKQIPKDISIVGFDSEPITFLIQNCIDLTSAVHPKKHLGYTSAQVMLSLLSSKGDVADHVIKHIISGSIHEGNTISTVQHC